jgi:hypothetical protein
MVILKWLHLDRNGQFCSVFVELTVPRRVGLLGGAAYLKGRLYRKIDVEL